MQYVTINKLGPQAMTRSTSRGKLSVSFTVLPVTVLFSHSSRVADGATDHIRYHATSPAKAANQVANRTCPVGCLRAAMAS